MENQECQTIVVADANFSFGQLGKLFNEQIEEGGKFCRLTIGRVDDPLPVQVSRIAKEIALVRERHPGIKDVFVMTDNAKVIMGIKSLLPCRVKGCKVQPLWVRPSPGVRKIGGAVFCCSDWPLHGAGGLMKEKCFPSDDRRVYAFPDFPFTFLDKDKGNQKRLAWLRGEFSQNIRDGLQSFWFIGHTDCPNQKERKLCPRDALGCLSEAVTRLRTGVSFDLPIAFGLVECDPSTGQIVGKTDWSFSKG